MSNFKSTSKIPNDIQKALRDKISPSGIGDKFATFAWRGQNSWSEYHCLILNSGSDLKWSNSGSIKNTYSNSLYELNKTLLGVSVDVKSISLKLGLFVVTAEEYRKFLYWMDPMAIDRLEFSTDTKYYYYAKLSNIGESTKWVIGKNNDGSELYYVELSVSFELQGDNYAYGKMPHVWQYNTENTNWKLNDIEPSALRNSFIIEFKDLTINPGDILTGVINREEDDDTISSKVLFSLTFASGLSNFGLNYNSKEGLISTGNGQLLSLLTKPGSILNVIIVDNYDDPIDSIDDINTKVTNPLEGYYYLIYTNFGNEGIKQRSYLYTDQQIWVEQTLTSRILSSYQANKFLLPSKYEDQIENLNKISISFAMNNGDFVINPNQVRIYCYDKVPII